MLPVLPSLTHIVHAMWAPRTQQRAFAGRQANTFPSNARPTAAAGVTPPSRSASSSASAADRAHHKQQRPQQQGEDALLAVTSAMKSANSMATRRVAMGLMAAAPLLLGAVPHAHAVQGLTAGRIPGEAQNQACQVEIGQG